MLNKLIVDPSLKDSIFKLRDTLSNEISPIIKSGRPLIVLCIGTDRSTGDSLGPLVGDKLKFLIRDKVYLYGNLENPVHAKNLSAIINEIYTKFKNPFVIAIDACLGSLQNVGKVIVEGKPLCPGSAMNKDLPKIGDLSITGIVNISGAMEFMVLQNTRLFTVMQLAEVISRGLYHSIIKTIGGKRSNNILQDKLIENIEA
jgi:putative sporulation protein YyaC